MRNHSLKIKMILITVLAVLLIAVSYYFWEDYLFSHFLGGYDQHGLPKQQSYSGFYFFAAAWPLWLYPIFLFSLLSGILYMIGFDEKIREARQHYDYIQIIKKQKEELEEELQDAREQIDAILAMGRKKNKKLKAQLEHTEQELKTVMVEYEKSLSVIEKLLVDKKGYRA